MHLMKNIRPASSLSEILDAKDDVLFLGTVYMTLLNRLPDPEGFSYYTSKLANGKTRRKVVADIASSPEAKRMAVSLPGLETLVKFQNFKNFLSAGKKDIVVEKFHGFAELSSGVEIAKNSEGYDRMCMRANYVSREIFDQHVDARQTRTGRSKIWFDLTFAMEWTGGVAGIIRAELEVAAGLKKMYPEIGYVTLLGNGFVEIPHEELKWLFSTENVAESYMKHFGRDKNGNTDSATVDLTIPKDGELYHPFAKGDAVISMGWMGSEKEPHYGKVKRQLKDFYICYLIYDIILLNDETRRFYPPGGRVAFEAYVKWVSENADFILYGGETAKNDTESLQKAKGWPTPPGLPIKFGTDIVKSFNQGKEETLLRSLGITGDFIITVGSIEPRKNHDTLYRAYLYALEEGRLNVPQLVICGKPLWRAENFMEAIQRDPRVNGKIIHLTPSEQELALLYKHCLFTVLPSLYEGWSLTLPESLGQGKFCLATDTPSLREIGDGLADFVDGWDVKGWAESISHYSSRKDLLAARVKNIRENWPASTWKDSARSIYQGVSNYIENHPSKKLNPEIWIDLTTSYLYARGIGGIVRAELTFARYIYQQSSDVHFFAFDRGNFFEIEKGYLEWLLNDLDLTQQFSAFQNFWNQRESTGEAYRNPFATGLHADHPAIMRKFPEEAIFMFLAIDPLSGYMSRNERIAEIAKYHPGIMTMQLIYDFTPVLFPQLHLVETCEPYLPFIKYAYNNFDFLMFGGKTAMRDGENLRNEENWRSPQTGYIEFGSDVGSDKPVPSPEEDKAVLKKFGITGDFLMTVGTIEPRKNHEMLYKAFLTLRKRGFKKLPQLVIVGKPGWKTEVFRAILDDDDRVVDLIKVISPNDDELDTLYRHCQFTLLPSFYEGWSLTLPESLSYGKFCLVSDSAPLRETGRDLVDYVNPLDTFAWAERIAYYVEHAPALSAKEERIRQEWVPKTWKECSKELLEQSLLAYERTRVGE